MEMAAKKDPKSKFARPVRNLFTIVLAGFFFPRRAGNAVGWLLDRTLFRFLGPKEDEKHSE